MNAPRDLNPAENEVLAMATNEAERASRNSVESEHLLRRWMRGATDSRNRVRALRSVCASGVDFRYVGEEILQMVGPRKKGTRT